MFAKTRAVVIEYLTSCEINGLTVRSSKKWTVICGVKEDPATQFMVNVA
ncbi:hypothetical protein [Exiguobacterium sp. PvP048]